MRQVYQIGNGCIGCTLCAKNCPVRAISGEPKQRHVIDPGLCVGCGLCGRLCPRQAVLDPRGQPCARKPKGEWPRPQVAEDSCAGCSVCVEACPKNCLAIRPPRFRGDIRTVAVLAQPEECIGCGLCAKACPIGAIGMEPR